MPISLIGMCEKKREIICSTLQTPCYMMKMLCFTFLPPAWRKKRPLGWKKTCCISPGGPTKSTITFTKTETWLCIFRVTINSEYMNDKKMSCQHIALSKLIEYIIKQNVTTLHWPFFSLYSSNTKEPHPEVPLQVCDKCGHTGPFTCLACDLFFPLVRKKGKR